MCVRIDDVIRVGRGLVEMPIGDLSSVRFGNPYIIVTYRVFWTVLTSLFIYFWSRVARAV